MERERGGREETSKDAVSVGKEVPNARMWEVVVGTERRV